MNDEGDAARFFKVSRRIWIAIPPWLGYTVRSAASSMSNVDIGDETRRPKAVREHSKTIMLTDRSKTPFLFPIGTRFGENNLVLHARAKRHTVADFSGTLSIKTVMNGQVSWNVEGRELVVEPHSFLILHDGERYSMQIDELHPVETCCVFFRRGYVEEIGNDMTSSLEDALDSPGRLATPLRFDAKLHVDTMGLLPQVWSLAGLFREQLQPSGLEDAFLRLSVTLLALQQDVLMRIPRVPAARAATRSELFRRVQLAKEYLHSCVDGRVSLADIAQVACLSPYHLHRTFTAVFGVTPHRYLTDLKLARAHMLLETGQSVTEVAYDVGFSSVSSFSRLFRTRFGVRPSEVNQRMARR